MFDFFTRRFFISNIGTDLKLFRRELFETESLGGDYRGVLTSARVRKLSSPWWRKVEVGLKTKTVTTFSSRAGMDGARGTARAGAGLHFINSPLGKILAVGRVAIRDAFVGILLMDFLRLHPSAGKQFSDDHGRSPACPRAFFFTADLSFSATITVRLFFRFYDTGTTRTLVWTRQPVEFADNSNDILLRGRRRGGGRRRAFETAERQLLFNYFNTGVKKKKTVMTTSYVFVLYMYNKRIGNICMRVYTKMYTERTGSQRQTNDDNGARDRSRRARVYGIGNYIITYNVLYTPCMCNYWQARCYSCSADPTVFHAKPQIIQCIC